MFPKKLVLNVLYGVYVIGICAFLFSLIIYKGGECATEIRILLNSGVAATSPEIQALKKSFDFYVKLGLSLAYGGFFTAIISAIKISSLEKH